MFIFYLVVVLLIPAILAFIGRRWRKHPPEKMSYLYGYRTGWSMKSRATWDFAHKYIGKLWSAVAIPSSAVSVVVLFLYLHSGIDEQGYAAMIITGAQAVLIILTALPTEIALRKNFDEYGRRKK